MRNYNEYKKETFINKGLYYANVIHELRAPLGSVLGYTSMLYDSEIDAERKKSLKITLDASKYMLDIVNDTLDFSKIRSGTLSLNPVQFVIKNTIERIMNVFNMNAQNKNIHFTLTYQNNCTHTVHGDEFRFTQIIINLLSNAFKFTPAHGHITIRLDYNDEILTTTITDSGPGISPEQIAKLFMPFAQTTDLSMINYGGTGLGLAISKELTTLLGGKIQVQSKLKEGSSFIVEIPFKLVTKKASTTIIEKESVVEKWLVPFKNNEALKKVVLMAITNLPHRLSTLKRNVATKDSEQIAFLIHKMKGFTGTYGFTELYEIFKSLDESSKNNNTNEKLATLPHIHKAIESIEEIITNIPESYLTSSPAAENSHAQKSNMRILIIDDDKDNRELMKHMCEDLGLYVEAHEDPIAALAILKKNEYDIVILDLHMPKISGFDLLKKMQIIKKNTFYVLATADTDAFILNKIKHSKFHHHLIKPITNQDLRSLLNTFQMHKERREYDSSTLKITIHNSNTTLQEVAPGTKVGSLINKKEQGKYIATKVNNIVTSLSYTLKVNSQVEFLEINTKEGTEVYRRSLAFLLAKTVSELHPKQKLIIMHSLGHGYYYELENHEFSAEEVDAINTTMREEVEKDKPIIRGKMNYEEAMKILHEEGAKDKISLFESLHFPRIVFYQCENYFEMIDAPLVSSTGLLQIFDVIPYNKGLILQFPNPNDITTPAPFVEQKKIFEVYRSHKELSKWLHADNVGSLNTMIRSSSIKDFIQVSEALQEKQIVQIADEIYAQRNKIKLITIAGPSSSGKTTFSKRLSCN